MKMTHEEIVTDPHTDMTIAIIVPREYDGDHDFIKWLTPATEQMQLGVMRRPQGHFIKPHTHRQRMRYVHWTRETIFVQSGRVDLDLYDTKGEYLKTCSLDTGTLVWLGVGGHGFRFTEESQLVEVKQGPAVPRIEDKVEL